MRLFRGFGLSAGKDTPKGGGVGAVGGSRGRPPGLVLGLDALVEWSLGRGSSAGSYQTAHSTPREGRSRLPIGGCWSGSRRVCPYPRGFDVFRWRRSLSTQRSATDLADSTPVAERERADPEPTGTRTCPHFGAEKVLEDSSGSDDRSLSLSKGKPGRCVSPLLGGVGPSAGKDVPRAAGWSGRRESGPAAGSALGSDALVEWSLWARIFAWELTKLSTRRPAAGDLGDRDSAELPPRPTGRISHLGDDVGREPGGEGA